MGIRACLKTRTNLIEEVFYFIIACEVGWTNFKNLCYFAKTVYITWVEARDECQALGSALITINNQEVSVSGRPAVILWPELILIRPRSFMKIANIDKICSNEDRLCVAYIFGSLSQNIRLGLSDLKPIRVKNLNISIIHKYCSNSE